MARWTKGKSGNPIGRAREGAAITDLARHQIEKQKLVEKLGSIGAGQEGNQVLDLVSSCAPFSCYLPMVTARPEPKSTEAIEELLSR